MKILITGSTGQLGTDCTAVFSVEHQVTPLSEQELDITDSAAVHRAIRAAKPEVVLNCAAFTRVDACESEIEQTWKINVEGPVILARSIKEAGGRLVHISTDYVFDGTREIPLPYVEDDTPGPLSRYGASKHEAEEAVRHILADATIVRTAWLYGATGTNFLKTMLRLSLQNPNRTIKVVSDQFGSPTWSFRLAQQLIKLIQHGGGGIYHATAEGYCTWYELARYFLSAMNVPFNLVPCSTADYPTPAVRPRNSILENKRLKSETINLMRPWHT
ncbi:MAG TPA: dTDP-4-dehydrorhamnose reductase, partial [Thermodesulfobacteriota bacterium]|nr:dTDP-4-dehydrorhamnose reductase [Thermodesulfobacteriota bacterium]